MRFDAVRSLLLVLLLTSLVCANKKYRRASSSYSERSKRHLSFFGHHLGRGHKHHKHHHNKSWRGSPGMPCAAPAPCPDITCRPPDLCPTSTPATSKPCVDLSAEVSRCFEPAWTRSQSLISPKQLELVSAIFSVSYPTYSLSDLSAVFSALKTDQDLLVKKIAVLALASPNGQSTLNLSNENALNELNNLNQTFVTLEEQRMILEETLQDLQQRNSNCLDQNELVDEIAPVFETPIADHAGNKRARDLAVRTSANIVWSVLANLNISHVSRPTLQHAVQQLHAQLFATCVAQVAGYSRAAANATFTSKEEVLDQLQVLFIQHIEAQLTDRDAHSKLASGQNVHLLHSRVSGLYLDIFEARKKITVLNTLIKMLAQELQICIGKRNF